MKKWLAVAVGCMTLITTTSHAGGPDVAPPPPGKVLAGIDYGWFQQSNTNTEYAILSSTSSSTSNPRGDLIAIPIDYHSGWGAHLGYLFSNENDILLSNLVYSGRDNGEISSGEGQVVFMSALPPGIVTATAGGAFSVYTYRTDLYQLTLGHRFHFWHDAFMVHPFIGAGLGKVWEDQDTYYTGTPVTLPPRTAEVSSTSSFNGIGPALGLNLSCNIWRWFNLVGGASWTGVIAKTKQDVIAYNDSSTTDFQVSSATTFNPALVNIITFEAGLSADFQIKEEDMEVLFGYRGVNVLVSNNLITEEGSVATSDSMSNSLRQFSFNGPFIRVSTEIAT